MTTIILHEQYAQHLFYQGFLSVLSVPFFCSDHGEAGKASVEVDFIVETSHHTAPRPPNIIAIEVKRANKWNREWEKHLRSLISLPNLWADRLIAVYTGKRSYRFDSMDVMPVETFFDELHHGTIF